MATTGAPAAPLARSKPPPPPSDGKNNGPAELASRGAGGGRTVRAGSGPPGSSLIRGITPPRTPPSAFRSVRHCGSYSIVAWRRDGEGRATAFPCLCKSWRCDAGCAWKVAREDYRRIETAATSRRDWVYLVLTLDPREHRDRWAAFRVGGLLWDKRLRRRLEREHGRLEYVQTWEQHRSGFPHVNILLRSPALLDRVRELGIERRTAKGPHGERRALFPLWRRDLARLAPECGFGLRVWAELIEPESAQGMAAYLAKHALASELTRAHTKHGDQRPKEAPRHFRRVRSSRGLLPPRKTSSGQWTGFLVKQPVERIVDRTTGEISLDEEQVAQLWVQSHHTDVRTSIRRAVRAWRERWGECGSDPSDEGENPSP